MDEPQNNYAEWKKPDMKECDGHTATPIPLLAICVCLGATTVVSNFGELVTLGLSHPICKMGLDICHFVLCDFVCVHLT